MGGALESRSVAATTRQVLDLMPSNFLCPPKTDESSGGVLSKKSFTLPRYFCTDGVTTSMQNERMREGIKVLIRICSRVELAGAFRKSVRPLVPNTEWNKMGTTQGTERRQEGLGRKPKLIIGLQCVYQRLQVSIRTYLKNRLVRDMMWSCSGTSRRESEAIMGYINLERRTCRVCMRSGGSGKRLEELGGGRGVDRREQGTILVALPGRIS